MAGWLESMSVAGYELARPTRPNDYDVEDRPKIGISRSGFPEG